MDPNVMETDFDRFFDAYVECALWSSTDEDDIPLDKNYTVTDMSADCLGKMKEECTAFLESLEEKYPLIRTWSDSQYERAGHDFWLTRNRHGAGFCDGDWPKAMGKFATELSHKYGECYLYVSDDNWVEIMH